MVRKLIIIWTALLFAGLSFAQEAGKFDFESKVHKFGKVAEGEQLAFEYTFNNTGGQPIIISDVKVACSCTKVAWPKEPVLPGKTGVLKVTFDTKGKIAYQERTLEIISNAKTPSYKVKFKGTVDNKKKDK